MNILYIYSSNIIPTHGGVQRVTKDLSDYFRSKAHNCYYLSSQPNNDSIENQFVLPNTELLNEQNIRYIQSLLKEKTIDVVVNQDGLHKIMTKLVHTSCYGHAKIFTVAHNSLLSSVANFTIVRYPLFERLYFAWLLPLFRTSAVKRVMNAMYRNKYKQHYQDILKYSNQFVLLSNAYKKELAFFLPDFPQDKVCAIYNPCTIVCKDDEIIEKKKVILYVGRISFAQKRNDLLLHVWKNIELKHRDWQLKIVGEGEDLPKLKIMAKEMNLTNISFEGFKSPELYYKEASIFCLTSAYEGFPLVLVEAMSYGVVPVAFNSYGAAENVIDNCVNGYLVKPFDEKEYTKIIESLIGDKLQLADMSRQSVLKAKTFSIDNIGSQWLKLYQDK